jgi:hypothetical protein
VIRLSKYDEFIDGKHTFNVKGIDTTIYAEPEDYAEFVKKVQSFKNDKMVDMSWVVSFTKKLAVKADPSLRDDKGFDRYLWASALELPDKLMIAFRMTSKEELEELKKQAKSEVKKNED